MSTIDPLRLAQFMVLPGAAELVDAFSAIPPGPVRDSVVHHARVLAEASGWTPPGFAMHTAMEPARIAGPSRLPSPFADGLVSTSAEGQIVERAMRGEPDHLIAADLGVKLGVVVRLKRKARREGGVVFPGDEGAPAPKAKGKAKGYSPLSGRKVPGVPIPPPPYWWEDPKSPVWENRALLPAFSENPTGSMAAIGPHEGRAFTAMEAAASRRGMTMRDYLGQRMAMVRRVEAGEEPSDVAVSYGRPVQEVYSLLTKVGRNHMRTIMARAAEPPPAPPAPPPVDRSASADWARQAAADKWGFPTVAAYEAMRIKVRDLRMEGWHRIQIVKHLGMQPAFVKTAIQYWSRERGVRFPAAPYKLKTVKAA